MQCSHGRLKEAAQFGARRLVCTVFERPLVLAAFDDNLQQVHRRDADSSSDSYCLDQTATVKILAASRTAGLGHWEYF